ncbi:hypothetical protein V8Z74_19400 [Comamonas sp. w2-DMI]|uniref:hypothetical protein n=1 Tax=Comamonas sp. w2-DMI TaxID=3126391 RepID=UPI0032E3BB23
MTQEQQPEALRLADALENYAYPCNVKAAAELRRLHAENEEMRETLQFVERWAGSKPSCTPAEALSCIQHYPPIRAITDSYADGKRPETFDPYARIAELEAQRKPLTDEQIEGLPIWANFVGLWPESRQEITRAIERAHGIGEEG